MKVSQGNEEVVLTRLLNLAVSVWVATLAVKVQICGPHHARNASTLLKLTPKRYTIQFRKRLAALL